MKKIVLILTFILFAAPAAADADVAEIIERYNISLGDARAYCSGLSEQINSIKALAGIGVGAGAVGTIAGTTALVTGIMKYNEDQRILKISNMSFQELRQFLTEHETEYRKLIARSQTLGHIRTAGAFVAGASGAVGAVTAFSGAGNIDDLVENMNACNSNVQDIEKQMIELRFMDPDHSAIAQMSRIVENCRGMDFRNIENVKGRLRTAGVLSVVGGVAGVVGGITSAMAVSKERQGAEDGTYGLNRAANISSGVAAAGNLGGAILSGTVLAGLNRNSDIAGRCAGAF